MPALDPDVEQLLELGRKAGRPPFQALTPKEARAAYAASWDVLQTPSAEVASCRDITLPGIDGDLVVRVYRAQGSQSDERLPCLVFLHGGGWVIGNLDSHDRLCRRLANKARICVVAVDYRLAPEHPFPAALDDGLAALKWVTENVEPLCIAVGRIGIAGDSAGGNLAAVLALMGRDGSAPASMFQALLYPVLDLTADSNSYRDITDSVPLTAATMHYFIDHYTPDAADRLDWRASPLRVSSLAGTPPALVMTVANDPLCDEGRAYAGRLEKEGVRVTALHMSDQLHGMLMMGRLVRASNVIVDFIADVIGDALHHGAPTEQVFR
ncbi:MAG: alpha/beta hydrolase [Burkholderiaceae bacterium]|nr:alpha/beta hydrolase [Burkholderiaceae bacterium]